MKNFDHIEEEVQEEFEKYIEGILNISGYPRKYYYWSLEFFKTVGGLSFQHFDLTTNQKDEINFLGSKFFNKKNVRFVVNENSHRNDIDIHDLSKIKENPKKERSNAIDEYHKEYVFWKVLDSYRIDLQAKLEYLRTYLSEASEEDIREKEEELQTIVEIVQSQKSNFLITYVKFLLERYDAPIHSFFIKNYKKYLLTSQGENLVKKLDEIDRDFVYDPKTKKEIKRTVQHLNPVLRKKIAKLYILRSEEQTIHFVFSRNTGGEKEELRELLEVMGEKKTGRMYRGQANSSWVLDASMTREPKYLEHEGSLYYEILSLKPDAFENDNSVYERLITMQHYGMPTRLLDTTRNPLVAVFFACNNWENRYFDGTIFTFSSPEEKSDFLNFEDERLKCLTHLYNPFIEENKKNKAEEFLAKNWFIKGVAKNQRINNQSGDFIFVGTGQNVKEKLHTLSKATIIIDSKSKKILIEQLDSLNIHGGAVYPDLTHISNYVKNKYEKLDTLDSTKEKKVLGPKTQKISSPIAKASKNKRFGVRKGEYPTFDFRSIKAKSDEEKFSAFVKFYNLKREGLDRLIEDFLFTERVPFRNEITKTSNTKLSVIKDKARIDSLTQDIITLAKSLKKK